jgi:hypothetical protein
MRFLGCKHSLAGFERSLEDLRADILRMARLVRRNLSNAKIGFAQRDNDYCSGVIANWGCHFANYLAYESELPIRSITKIYDKSRTQAGRLKQTPVSLLVPLLEFNHRHGVVKRLTERWMCRITGLRTRR